MKTERPKFKIRHLLLLTLVVALVSTVATSEMRRRKVLREVTGLVSDACHAQAEAHNSQLQSEYAFTSKTGSGTLGTGTPISNTWERRIALQGSHQFNVVSKKLDVLVQIQSRLAARTRMVIIAKNKESNDLAESLHSLIVDSLMVDSLGENHRVEIKLQMYATTDD
ncbi:MAG: hypothetical protein AAF394_02030 [Planctomycetota bacterium]